MKLELSQSLQQQQILAPQMILSMDILLLPSLDLEQRVRQEFAENPALEVVDPTPEPAPVRPPAPTGSAPPDTSFTRWETVGAPAAEGTWFTGAPRRRSDTGERHAKHEALQNTEGRPPGLKDSLTEQVHLLEIGDDVRTLAEEIIQNLDHRGYLVCAESELRASMASTPGGIVFDEALAVVRGLDPAGVGAEDLRQCLLLQLERDRQTYPLETAIIEDHLLDLGLNKIPKIARDLGTTVDEIKDAVEIISCLDPIPGGRLESEPTVYIRPDVFVEVVDDEITVRVEAGNLPPLKVSESCQEAYRKSSRNPEIKDFLRKKIKSAQWLIQAIEQRQETLRDIAYAMTSVQREFMLRGPEHLRAMKMQEIADAVGVHISTISRAIKGKHMQTPWGLFEMRYFFTGGVGNADGEVESRRNVARRIAELIESEDKAKPYSDNKIADLLREEGLKIARRTVTKYREQQSIPSSRLRRSY